MTDTPPPNPAVPLTPGATAATDANDTVPPQVPPQSPPQDLPQDLPRGPWPADAVPPQAAGFGPPPAHHPWGPPQPVPPMPGRNGKAVASFVLGLVGVFPLGLLFGILALIDIGRTRQKGKGLAIFGLVLSGLWTLVTVLGVLGAAFYLSTTVHSSAQPALGGGRTGVTIFSLPVGSCYDLGSGANVAEGVIVLPCSRPHDRQLIANASVAGGAYPGVAEAKRRSLLACLQAESNGFVDLQGAFNEAGLNYVYPTGASWTEGEPALCELGTTAGGAQLTRDLRQTPGQFTAQQRAFLDTVRQTYLLRRELEDAQDRDWSQGRAIASRLAVADRAEARALAGLSALNTAALRQAGSALAQDDLAQAAKADVLARVSDQGGWTAGAFDVTSSPWEADQDSIRAGIGLG